LIIISLILITPVFSENEGEIEGYVKDKQTGLPLTHANIIIEGTQIKTTTDINGYFNIKGLPPGIYKIRVQHIGYKSIIKKVSIKTDIKVKLLFLLDILKAQEKIEVIAKREVFSLTSISSTINKNEINRSNLTTTAEALKMIPGIFTNRPGGWGVKVVIQGMKDDRILLLIDGARVNQACPMGMDACTATIEPSQIEYIEVIKGPHSVIYGSGNFAGIINIITKKPKILKTAKLSIYGNLNAIYNSVSNGRKVGFNFGGRYKSIDFLIGIIKSNYEDYRIPGGVVKNSKFRDMSYNFKLKYRLDNKQQIQFTIDRYLGRDIGYPSNFIIIPKENRSLYNLSYSANNLSRTFASLSVKLYAQNMYHNAITLSSRKSFIPEEEAFSNTYGLLIRGDFILNRKSILTIGTDFNLWKTKAIRYDGNFKKTELIKILPTSYISYFSIFGQNRIEIIPKLNITIGARIDISYSNAQLSHDFQIKSQKADSLDKFVNGNLSLFYELSDSINLTASIGRAYKIANPTERYFSATMKDGYYYIGTPNLRPEKNLSIQVGIRSTNKNLKWSISFFQNKLTDLISTKIDPLADPPFLGVKGVKRYINIGKATVRGLESELGIVLSKLVSLYGNFLYNWGRDDITGEPLAQIPPLESRLALRLNDSKELFWAECSGRFVTEQKRISISAGEVVTPGFSIFDFKGGIRFSKFITLNFGIENIFNKAYREHLNLAQIPEPGRNFYVRLNIGWKWRSGGYSQKTKGVEKRKTEMIILRLEEKIKKEDVEKVLSSLKKIEGVISPEINMKNDKIIVEIWKNNVIINQLIGTLREIGYKAIPLRTSLQTIILKVRGVDCQYCANTMQIILKKIRGVISVEINFKERKAIIKIWKYIVPVNQLIEVIENLGFKASLLKISEK
jgi:iron complex outermembrane receptor protein